MRDFEQQAKDAHETVEALRRAVADHKKANARMHAKVVALEATIADHEKAATDFETTIAQQQAALAEHAETSADTAKKRAALEATPTEHRIVERDAAGARPDRPITERAAESEGARRIKPAPPPPQNETTRNPNGGSRRREASDIFLPAAPSWVRRPATPSSRSPRSSPRATDDVRRAASARMILV